MIIVCFTSRKSHVVFSSTWSRRKQAEMLDEWQNQPPESTLLGFIREIVESIARGTLHLRTDISLLPYLAKVSQVKIYLIRTCAIIAANSFALPQMGTLGALPRILGKSRPLGNLLPRYQVVVKTAARLDGRPPSLIKLIIIYRGLRKLGVPVGDRPARVDI